MQALTVSEAAPEATFEPSAYLVDSPYQRRILAGLNISGKHIYAGTVPAAEKARRRAANKAARKARKATR